MIVDVHAHYVSLDLISEARAKGASYGVAIEPLDGDLLCLRFSESGARLRPFFSQLCDLRGRVSYLDSMNVDVQIISAWTDMGGDDLTAEQGKRWARLQNETLTADAKASGGRFEAMGTLPMQSVDGAIAELEYVVRKLGMHSIQMGTNVNGRDLDHPEFRPLWRRLNDLDVLVLLHPPFKPVGLERAGDYFLNNLISYPVDTTIAAARLVFSGIMAELPDLKICLAHGGGFLPYQIGRMDRGFAAHPACNQAITKSPLEFLRSFYFDTLTHNTVALDFLADAVGCDRLVYGSDYPFEMLDESGTARIHEMKALSNVERDSILGGTAHGLLRGAPIAAMSA